MCQDAKDVCEGVLIQGEAGRENLAVVEGWFLSA
jgi:hypothetical protein